MKSEEFAPIIITTTSDSRETLEKISYQLIEAKLAACVQISGPIQSCYRWQDKVENSQEWSCAIKTSQQKFADVQSLVSELHNYDEPQLIAIAIQTGSSGYLEWMRESLV